MVKRRREVNPPNHHPFPYWLPPRQEGNQPRQEGHRGPEWSIVPISKMPVHGFDLREWFTFNHKRKARSTTLVGEG